jgi:hypothetical protein
MRNHRGGYACCPKSTPTTSNAAAKIPGRPHSDLLLANSLVLLQLE